MRGNKELAPIVAPFWAKTLDFPDSEKFGQAVIAMSPAPIKALFQPEDAQNQPDPAAMAQQMQEMQKALQEAIKLGEEAQEDADRAVAAMADAKLIADVKERELDIKAYDSETKRAQVMGLNEDQAKKVVSQLMEQMMSNPDPLPGDGVPQPEPSLPLQQGQINDMDQNELMEDEATQDEGETMPDESLQDAPVSRPLSPAVQALLEGQAALLQAVGSLVEISKKPRVKVPHRDKQGNLTHVTESLEN
jgi:hypothetical protein